MDNALSELWFARAKDSPAKTWWEAPIWHDAVGRAMCMNREEYAGVYALAPFRLAKVDGKALVLAAYPAPRIFTPTDEDWLGIETVIAWNPVDDTATVLGDAEPQLVGNLDLEPAIYARPRRFFQRWAQKRAAFAVQRQTFAGKDWHSAPREVDQIPGALLIGNPDKVRWRSYSLPRDLEVIDADPRQINRAILIDANLPRAFQRVA